MQKYALADQLSEQYPVDLVCQLFNITRSAYSQWLNKPEENACNDLCGHVKRVFEESKKAAGSRTIVAILRSESIYVGRYKVMKVMREAGLISKQPGRRHRYRLAKENHLVVLNRLNRHFTPALPNQIWSGDITYIWAGQWIYLAVVMNLYSRRVIGYALGEKADSDLVIRALDMAWQQRSKPEKVLFHPDQGSQYSSQAFMQQVKRYGMQQSMSRRGNCWDNAPTERLFRSLKSEWVPKYGYGNIAEAKSDLIDYLINYYNHRRPHRFNMGSPPAIYEQQSIFLS